MEAAEYDLIVAGAGPAGSACAITAARAGARVLLLERDHFPRQKVCGEFVSPESLGLLNTLLDEKTFPQSMPVSSARIFIDGRTLGLPVLPAAQSIPRFELDPAMFNAARQAGATVQEGVAIQQIRHNGFFQVTTAQETLSAKAVVNATGRWSKLTQFDVINKQNWLGLKAHFSEPDPPPSVDLYFFPGGYCGVTPVGANAVNACAMVRADVARSLEEVLSKQPELRRRSQDWKPLFPAVTTSPLYFREPETESEGVFLVGDAAGFIDPFAGDGISLALQSGALAARVLTPFLRDSYSLAEAHQLYRAAHRKSFASAFRNAARLRKALAAPRWVRSIALDLAGIPGVTRFLMSGTRARSL
ncbi:MAG TPA: NAD(P)/FAD-dependent oxidoreductase [Candidatus Angelobacter sp.]|nr:NAD(P)/FAD-dependent oxidoreductase [Candidatus Angelobacter sp.]